METNDIIMSGMQLKKLMMKKVEPIMKEYNLRPVELDLLFFLSKEKHVDTAKEIIEKKHLSKAHISKSIENLCNGGFIKLTADIIDRRIIHISLTDKSEVVVEKVANIYDECKQVIQKGITSDEYAYHAYNHYINGGSMYIYMSKKELSIAENFLRILRPDVKYTELEVKVLDVALLLHMEHGGGNNSTSTTRVVTSSGSDTYSVIAAAMSSLKGAKHGGANLMVMNMMDDIKAHVKDYKDEDEIAFYLNKILNKEAFDRKGLIKTNI